MSKHKGLTCMLEGDLENTRLSVFMPPTLKNLLYIVCGGGGGCILFSCCPSVFPSVTFWFFFNILKRQ